MADQIKALEVIRANDKAVFKLLSSSGMKMGFFANSVDLYMRQNPKLANCTQQSIIECVLLSAQMGFLPGYGNDIHYVPYGTKCQPIIGYNGLRKLAERGGMLDANAHIVFSNDVFEIDRGKTPPFKHIECLEKNRGEMIGAYAVTYKKSGHCEIEWMPKSDIDAIRSRSAAKDSGPWVTDYNEMARKTVLRRALKNQPLNIMMQKAIELDNRAESGQSIRDIIELEPGEFKELDEAPKLSADNMTASTSAAKPKPRAKQAEPQAQTQTPPAEYKSTDSRSLEKKLQYISANMGEGDLIGIITPDEITESINAQFRAPRNQGEFKGWNDMSVEEADYIILTIDSRKQGKE